MHTALTLKSRLFQTNFPATVCTSTVLHAVVFEAAKFHLQHFLLEWHNFQFRNILTSLKNKFFGKSYTVLPANKNCDRRQGCVEHDNKCVQVEFFEQTDEVQFGTVDLCKNFPETKYVKLYSETTDSLPQVFDTEGCTNLGWEIFDKPILQGKTINQDVVIDSERAFVDSAVQETFTVLEIAQIYPIEACNEAVQFLIAQNIWQENSIVNSAQCFGIENCATPAKSVVNETCA